MKKQWVELRKGIMIEVGAIRSVNAGQEKANAGVEGQNLFVKYVGDRTATTLTFSSVDAKWKAYSKLNKALTELNKAESKNG